MPSLAVNFAGLRSVNPFWVASGPPSNTEKQAHRAFEAGWGGFVWKTIGAPIVNVTSRYSALSIGQQRIAGFSNIELISDRSPETNFREISRVKARWPDRLLIASLMTDTRESWREFVQRAEDSGADALELNFGCPHGMCERGMGSAVGQNPDVIETITSWVAGTARVPVLVKLTPNVTSIVHCAQAARQGGASAISLINTISSVTGVNLDTLRPEPPVRGLSTPGGYSGPAVKPIALNMVQQCASACPALPLSGIGGIANWRDAAEFIALGATTVQVCTAIMHHGFRIVEDMNDGLLAYLARKNLESPEDLRARALPAIVPWERLDLRHRRVARIRESACIRCNLCHIACEDGAHQAIDLPPLPAHLPPGALRPAPRIREDDCVGCNLCALVCPAENCIEMVDLPADPALPPLTWATYQLQLAAGSIPPIPPKH